MEFLIKQLLLFSSRLLGLGGTLLCIPPLETGLHVVAEVGVSTCQRRISWVINAVVLVLFILLLC